MRRTMVLAAVVLLALGSSVFAAPQYSAPVLTRDYPINVAVVPTANPNVMNSVVMVLWVDGAGNQMATQLDRFLNNWINAAGNVVQGVVQEALMTNGQLPTPSTQPTLRTAVTFPMSKPAYVWDANNLPVSLRVVATPRSSATEDRHERFDGWVRYDVDSYFITRYTADVRVTKFHSRVVRVTNTFRWVDP